MISTEKEKNKLPNESKNAQEKEQLKQAKDFNSNPKNTGISVAAK